MSSITTLHGFTDEGEDAVESDEEEEGDLQVVVADMEVEEGDWNLDVVVADEVEEVVDDLGGRPFDGEICIFPFPCVHSQTIWAFKGVPKPLTHSF